MNPDTIRDKYKGREKDSSIEKIIKLMQEFGITSDDLTEYQKTHTIDLRQQVVELKRKSRLRGLGNGIRGRREQKGGN